MLLFSTNFQANGYILEMYSRIFTLRYMKLICPLSFTEPDNPSLLGTISELQKYHSFIPLEVKVFYKRLFKQGNPLPAYCLILPSLNFMKGISYISITPD